MHYFEAVALLIPIYGVITDLPRGVTSVENGSFPRFPMLNDVTCQVLEFFPRLSLTNRATCQLVNHLLHLATANLKIRSAEMSGSIVDSEIFAVKKFSSLTFKDEN